jgi:Tfp pilus assembly protein PilO
MKNKHILLSVLLITIVAFGFYPLLQVVDKKEQKNEQLFAQKQQQIERLTKLENAGKEMNTQISIPSTPEQIALIDDVSRIAKATGIALPDNWSFSIGHNSDVNAEQISISFTLSGRREQIQRFLAEVEKNPRFMGVRDFSFNTDVGTSISITEMPITLYAFFLEA